MLRIIPVMEQFFDDDGNPLSGGKLHFTVSGTNDTDKDTFADALGTTPNTNPVILDAAGRCPSAFGTGTFRVTLYDSDDVLISQRDSVSGGGGGGGIPFWDNITPYIVPNTVIGDDLNLYRAIVDNDGEDPTSSATFWEQVDFNSLYNATRTYQEDELCISSTGKFYRSLVAANINNTPSASPTEWYCLEDEVIALEAVVAAIPTDSKWGPWQTPSFTTGWTDGTSYGYRALKYRRSLDGENVQISGAVKYSSGGTSLVTTLASGYRPAYKTSVSAGRIDGSAGSSASTVEIDTSGQVTIAEFLANRAFGFSVIFPLT